MPIDDELIYEFFSTVSRIEYGLKSTGYFHRARHGGAAPNWDRFAAELAGTFNMESNEDLHMACLYYIAQPPGEQVVENNRLVWSQGFPDRDSEFESLLSLVRRVRNNLFHGGKSNPQGSDESERNMLLLRYGLIILNEAVRLNPQVQAACEDAAI